MSKWPLVAMSEVADIERNGIQASEIQDGTLYVGLENIVSGGDFLDVRKVASGELASSKFRFTPSHLLYGKLRPYLAKIARPTFSGVCSTDILPVLPGAKLSRDYLSHYLRRQEIVDLANARASGANLPRLSPRALASFEIPLPPLTEQRRIATILDQAETLRAQRRAAIAQLDSLGRAVFLEIFDTALEDTERISLDDLVTEFRYGTSEKSSSTGYPALRIPNVTSGSLNLNELKTVPVSMAEFERLRLINGDLLFVRTNGNRDYVGRCAVFDQAAVAHTRFDAAEFIYASYLIRARLKAGGVLPIVLQWYLSDGEGRRALRSRCKTSAGQYNINTEGLGSLPIPSFQPDAQQQFAIRIRAIERLKVIHLAALARLDELFASLQHRAFRGELTPPTRASSPKDICVLEAAVGLEALIFVAKRMPAGRHHHYKSLKALYFADKRHLEKHGRMIYGETHSALPYGPVPQAAYDATRVLNGERLISDFDDEALRAGLRRAKDDQQDKLVALRDADFSKLGHAERESLEWAIRYCADMSFEQVKAASHDTAYERTPANAPIPVEYMTDMLPPEA
ncbi:type II toxin-antitoxin system antitoxin SocA domain-containing protein [Variovorax sp. DXTD-1]|uniref:type II toxin-antitoxin system antitoxin SocA domain-containing protein n=1 Tax=Variovorax sp. DXTD-1 TaxID=2495592 RepID=UPI000F88155C|nr:type II toxin-antitoxin system antitoxin SocA domain-containing protein [Variovorax sp. DXTD-1]RST49352.1 DUF4065 domain-containing protein [Variovorax sp. DXTD-1]